MAVGFSWNRENICQTAAQQCKGQFIQRLNVSVSGDKVVSWKQPDKKRTSSHTSVKLDRVVVPLVEVATKSKFLWPDSPHEPPPFSYLQQALHNG